MENAVDPAGASMWLAEELSKRGAKGVLVEMAKRGQLFELKCEMPQCYNPKGCRDFDRFEGAYSPWAPSADHYPILDCDGGTLVAQNVRLAHVRCNHLDDVIRTQIRTKLTNDKSLADIATDLNGNNVPPAHDVSEWTAALVRRAYVS